MYIYTTESSYRYCLSTFYCPTFLNLSLESLITSTPRRNFISKVTIFTYNYFEYTLLLNIKRTQSYINILYLLTTYFEYTLLLNINPT